MRGKLACRAVSSTFRFFDFCRESGCAAGTAEEPRRKRNPPPAEAGNSPSQWLGGARAGPLSRTHVRGAAPARGAAQRDRGAACWEGGDGEC